MNILDWPYMEMLPEDRLYILEVLLLLVNRLEVHLEYSD